MRNIKAKEVQDVLRKEHSNITIINVLPSSSFEEEHIPGSINIPEEKEDFVEQVKKKIKDKNTPIIVYCASFECQASSRAAKRLEKEKFTNVMEFEGGMEEWRTAGYKVERGVS